MRFSWIVLVLGLLGPLVVLCADWFTAAPLGETGHRHHHLRWYSPLPLLVWLVAIGAAAYPGLLD
jgi:hypothetical protein